MHESKVNIVADDNNDLRASANSSKDPTEGKKIGTKLAYKDMNDCFYYFATIAYQALVVFAACSIPHVDIVFNLVEVLCINCICFFFPAIFYILAANKKQKRDASKSILSKAGDEPRNKTLEICSYITFILGVIAFVLGGIDYYNSVIELINSQ